MKTILLAEDNEHDVFFMQRAFTRSALPHTMQVVRDGEEAVAYLSGDGSYGDREAYPEPALLLLDIKMPRRNGHEVLNWVRSQPQLHQLPIVMLTTSNDSSDIQRAYRAGANSYVVKPSSFLTLQELLPFMAKYWLDVNVIAT